MAHLWTATNDGEWRPFELCGDLWMLPRVAQPAPMATLVGAAPPRDVVALRRANGSTKDAWLLVTGPDAMVHINGVPLEHGIVVLVDRDEIRQPASLPIFYSAERLARVEPFPADGPRGFCPRCKQTIAAGDPAVKCPGCDLWHHASASLDCWRYDARCAACTHFTALDAGYQWTPEEL